jgi:hypothetical protein
MLLSEEAMLLLEALLTEGCTISITSKTKYDNDDDDDIDFDTGYSNFSKYVHEIPGLEKHLGDIPNMGEYVKITPELITLLKNTRHLNKFGKWLLNNSKKAMKKYKDPIVYSC